MSPITRVTVSPPVDRAPLAADDPGNTDAGRAEGEGEPRPADSIAAGRDPPWGTAGSRRPPVTPRSPPDRPRVPPDRPRLPLGHSMSGTSAPSRGALLPSSNMSQSTQAPTAMAAAISAVPAARKAGLSPGGCAAPPAKLG